ncbi:MAG: hypothetical protein F6K00_03550 [Leptolyngbya sp. SIOISBB]|nr:hypothetical protein [Leptolyngbya sp. SIOISBB]
MSPMDSYESWSSHQTASNADLENRLYDFLRYCRQQQDADQVLQHFHQLFIQADYFPDETIWDTLVELAHRPHAEREFKYTLNRCSYTLANPWSTDPRSHWAVPALVQLFEQIPTAPASTAETQTIRKLSRLFAQTDQYAALRRFANLIDDQSEDAVLPLDDQPVGKQLKRYPFLYDSSLLTKDSDQHQKSQVGKLRQEAEAKLGVQLARYCDQQKRGGSKTVQNPTQLSSEELSQALDYYTGKVEGNRSHRDLAQMFQTYSKTVRSFRDFKEEFLEYLLSPLADADPRYVNNHFGRALRQYLRDTLNDFDGQRLTEFIVITTCQKLLNFLVVQGRQQPVFRRFWQLLNDAGHTLTVGLLLRVVLFCSAVKPWLENRMTVLFNYHEKHMCKEVPWLVGTLEHMNIALLTNFGKFGYSFT